MNCFSIIIAIPIPENGDRLVISSSAYYKNKILYATIQPVNVDGTVNVLDDKKSDENAQNKYEVVRTLPMKDIKYKSWL